MNGPLPATTLAERLDISQPSFSRLVAVDPEVLSFGRARRTRYALRREDDRLPALLPVRRVDESGRVQDLAELVPTAADGFVAREPAETFHEGIPWYLQDARPQGFLGRLVPRSQPELGFPADIQLWTVAQTMGWFLVHGWNLPGDLLAGERALALWLEHAEEPPDLVPAEARPSEYARLCQDVLAFGVAGSSAAGEQPKFLATRAEHERLLPVLVKFSPPTDDAIARRVSDLLVCEHLASKTMHAAGHPSCRTAILEGAGRTFLEVERFDRVGWPGRRGTVTLEALGAAFTGVVDDWVRGVEALARSKRLPAAVVDVVTWRAAFGELIANTDRHAGNLTFFRQGFEITDLAPSYDMLPMAFAPRAGELVEPAWTPPAPRPGAIWHSAWEAAREFWNVVGADTRISTAFRERARSIRDVLDGQRRALDRLPR
ncbi:MAG: type II toxin-antitoxin system HipA family toxin YjjJ [Planctomycetes bacterium]|nr:type II toxin-antitoxin system HipA family toxin YjjJ [Planctomycetota bacterium]